MVVTPTGSTHTGDAGRAGRDALAALLIVGCIPLPVALVPVVGCLVGLTGYDWPPLLRWLIVLATYFVPCLTGAVLGWRGVCGRLGGWRAVTAWAGLVGNAIVPAISVLLIAGESISRTTS